MLERTTQIIPVSMLKRPTLIQSAMAVVLVFASVYWLQFGLTTRFIIDDDGTSILAAQSILDHGIPRLPSGFIYDRAYIPAYLLAGSLGIFGSDDLGITLPGVLLGLGVLLLTY